jgi:hypothetical protein
VSRISDTASYSAGGSHWPFVFGTGNAIFHSLIQNSCQFEIGAGVGVSVGAAGNSTDLD